MKIKTKDGRTVAFEFNKAQFYIHREVETQLGSTGKVRVIIVKGRQQGSSTYVTARYYHGATMKGGRSVFILSHEADSTRKLFEMVQRYHKGCPEPIKAEADVKNNKVYKFDGVGSDYTVGTAGNANVGRGGTVQDFHGSEVASWEKAEGLRTGVLQSVSGMLGTQIILESTGNGPAGYFYEFTMEALQGKNEFKVIFVPWFWQDEYAVTLQDGFTLTEKEQKVANMFKLTLPQMAWRRGKISELKSEWLFKREYPSTVMEAFEMSGNSLVGPMQLEMARKSDRADKNSPLVMGVDVGRTGDPTAFVFRRGRQWVATEKHTADESDAKIWEMKLVGMIARKIDRMGIDRVFIDNGLGYGVVARLIELGYGDLVTGVDFGSRDDKRYRNMRSQMAYDVKEWYETEEVSMPDEDSLASEILMVPDFEQTSNNVIYIKGKDVIRKANNGRSTDVFDALSLTFAFPVRNDMLFQKSGHKKFSKAKIGVAGPLTTLRRVGR